MWREQKAEKVNNYRQATNSGRERYQAPQKANGRSFVSQTCFPLPPHLTCAVGEGQRWLTTAAICPAHHAAGWPMLWQQLYLAKVQTGRAVAAMCKLRPAREAP